MHWKVKATVQNAVSLLPSALSYKTYYWLQRRFGDLKTTSPVRRLKAGIRMWRDIQSLGQDPKDKVFFEVGTGRTPVLPLALWLMGARRIITVDLNPYMKAEIVAEGLRYMRENQSEIERMFGSLLDQERFARLLERPDLPLPQFLAECCIDYVAPADAASTGLPADSVDYHVSYTTFEHIPPDVLSAILREGARIVRPDGLFLHRIDYSDHFAHSDDRISYVNFLQYSDTVWQAYAGNRYMYQNRLRHDDFLRLFEGAGHRVVTTEIKVDPRSQRLLSSGALRVNRKFHAKPVDTLATINALIVSQRLTR
jgi:SAM-dependent methyltransferase